MLNEGEWQLWLSGKRLTPNTQIESSVIHFRWYHGRLDRRTAEKRLTGHGQAGGYLVRESETKPGSYVLCYFGKTGINHFRYALFIPSPDSKILDVSKLKAFADNIKVKILPNDDFSLWNSRKHCGKRRKSLLPALSLFRRCFPKPSSSRSANVWIVRLRVKGVMWLALH